VKATTEQLVSALRVLSVEMFSEDGVANAVVAEAADRLTAMANLVARHVEETKDDIQQMAVASDTMVEATSKIQRLRAQIKRLEEAGDAMLNAWLMPEDSMEYCDWVALSADAKAMWHKARGEDKL
jgi:cysteinyl-tRNA synthetase